MENENKNNRNNANNGNNSNKNKHHRHKPYFIKPEQNQGSEKADAERSAPQPASQNENNASAKKKNKNKRPKPSAAPSQEKAEASAASNTAPKKDLSEDTPKESFLKKNNKNKRNRHKDRDKDRGKDKRKDEELDLSGISSQTSENADNTTEKPELSFFAKNDRLEKPAPKKLESFSSSPEYQKYKDYEEFTYEELYGEGTDSAEAETVGENKDASPEADSVTAEAPSVEVVGIRFKSSGKTYYFAPNGISLRIGSHAIVETARGLEYGEVVTSNSSVPESEIVPPLRPVIRAATPDDVKRNEEIKKNEETAFRICNEKIIAHGLDMKLIDAQYTFDNTKLLFYFTSSGRVDFRDLVKDLASVFRTRIELRQIGIRDEAKMVGGLGICGRPLCCSIFLSDFGQVSIKMAKEQNLSLNSSKISGICGRLMCCLRYEHDTYEYEIKRTPPVESLVRTVDGVGTVTEISPLQGTIKVRLAATPEAPPKSYKREDVTVLKKKN